MGRGLSTRRLAGCALVGIAGYLVLDVALVFLRPQFSVLHNAESDYGSTGRYAWVMDANFLLRCALSLAAAWALVRVLPLRFRTAFWFLVVWALASGLLAFFPDDPVGTRTRGPAKVHLLLALIAFAAVIVGTLLASRVIRRTPGWERVAPALTVIAWLAIVPILLLGHAKLRPRSLGGLWEKTFLALELLWLAVAAAWIVWAPRLGEQPDGQTGLRLPATAPGPAEPPGGH